MKYIFIVSFLMLIGCVHQAPLDDYSHYLRNKNIAQPSYTIFTHCFGYGCSQSEQVTLSEKQWGIIKAHFKPKPKSAQEERDQISRAIKSFEDIVGEITGTSADKKGTFHLYQDDNPKYNKFQQDCVDESTNTTIYLSLLQQQNLLKFHRTTQPQARQPFLSGRAWWHQTATIKEIETGDQYAVDSWFEDNGHKAHIVPIKAWFKGWKPKRD